jgi:hypothetical protein
VLPASAARLDASNDRPREVEYGFSFRAVATLWRFDEGEDRWTGGAQGTAKVLTHRSLAKSLLFAFRDAEEKLVAYHRLTPDTQLVKADDVTWEWRVAKDYADDDEGFPEQFKLSLHDVTSEPVACCPAAQRLVDNGGAMEVALVAIASYDPISHGFSEMDTLFQSSYVGCCAVTILQKHVRPDAIREAFGEDLYTSVAALVTLIRQFTPHLSLFGSTLRK